MFWEISLSLKSGYVTREEGIWESGRKREVVDALRNVFPQETQGQREISGQNFLQQDFYLLRFREKVWTVYLVVRLLDEGFHVVVPWEALLCGVIWKTSCSLLLHGDKIQYIFICKMLCAWNINSDRQTSNLCGCWFLLPTITEEHHHPEFYLHDNFSTA